MKTLRALFGMMALAMGTASAGAGATGFVELEILMFGVNEAESDAGSVTVSCVFDTNAAPIVLTNALRWQSIKSSMVSSQGSLSDVPFQIGESQDGFLYEFGDDEVVTADLTYFTVSNRYRLFVVAGGQSMIFDVLNASPGFDPMMDSLPEDLSQYQSSPMDPSYQVSLSSPSFTAAYPEGESDTGLFAFKVNGVESPISDDCVADINGDGQLDFLDVSAFLQSFNSGCP